MERWKSKLKRMSRIGAPPPQTKLEKEIETLGGTSLASELLDVNIQSKKKSISKDDRILELTKDNGRLRQEIAYLKPLVHDAQKLIPTLDFYATGLYNQIQEVNFLVDQLPYDSRGENIGDCAIGNPFTMDIEVGLEGEP